MIVIPIMKALTNYLRNSDDIIGWLVIMWWITELMIIAEAVARAQYTPNLPIISVMSSSLL